MAAIRAPIQFPMVVVPMVVALALFPSAAMAEACSQLRQGAPLTLSPVLLPAALPAAQPASIPSPDYRHRLRTTPLGWPLQAMWCVWVEPAPPEDPAVAISHRWQRAVALALAEWRAVVPIALVDRPERAQVTIWRRRPPLGEDSAGRLRASHGRAILSLHTLAVGHPPRVEPLVRVLISPDQRGEAIQATALHELGHAFGLWGHSDDPGDAMAVSPGSRPVLRLSSRDQATVRWLYGQPTSLRSDP